MTRDYSQASWIGDHPKDCTLALFTDASFASDLKDSKSTTGCLLVLIGKRTYAPISWLCKKQTAVSRSTAEEPLCIPAVLRVEVFKLKGKPAHGFMCLKRR